MKNKKTIIESAFLIFLLGLTLNILLKNQDVTKIFAIIKDCNLLYIAAAFAAMVIYVFCGGYEVCLFLKQRGYKMSLFRIFKYSFTEIFFSAITPSSTGGQPVMAIDMRNDGYPLTETTPALIAITGLYKLGLIIYGIIFGIIYGSHIFALTDDWVFYLFIFGFVINIIVVVFVWLFLFSNRFIWYIFKFVVFIARLFGFTKKIDKLESLVKVKKAQYVECANYMLEFPTVPLKVFVFCLIQRFSLSAVAVFVYKAMGFGGISFLYIIAIQIIVALTVEIIPLPGAVGISETVFLAFYMPIYGSPEALNAALLLTRGISFYILFIVSAFFVNICYTFNMVKKIKKRGIGK